jgi:hypothetical protein
LRAREQQQFLIGHPVKLSVPLKVTKTGNRSVRIRNLTPEEVPFALVRDGAQGYYLAEGLAAGASVECEVQSHEDIGGLLARYRADFIPTIPVGLQVLGSWSGFNGDAFTADVVDHAWLGNLSEDMDKSMLPPYGFVTLLRNNDQIYVPVAGKNSESTHLVLGRLVW